MPCRSLAPARSLLPPPPSSVASSWFPRCHRRRSIRHPSVASSSPRRHHLVITPACHVRPRLPPRPTCRGTGRGYGSATKRTAVVALLAYFMPLPRLCRFGSHPSRPRRLGRSCFPSMCRRRWRAMPCGRFDCFPVRAFQLFLKCCRVNLLKPCGSSV